MRQRLQQLVGDASRSGGGQTSDQAITSLNTSIVEKQPQNGKQMAKDIQPTKTNYPPRMKTNNDTEILIQSSGFVARLKPG